MLFKIINTGGVQALKKTDPSKTNDTIKTENPLEGIVNAVKQNVDTKLQLMETRNIVSSLITDINYGTTINKTINKNLPHETLDKIISILTASDQEKAYAYEIVMLDTFKDLLATDKSNIQWILDLLIALHLNESKEQNTPSVTERLLIHIESDRSRYDTLIKYLLAAVESKYNVLTQLESTAGDKITYYQYIYRLLRNINNPSNGFTSVHQLRGSINFRKESKSLPHKCRIGLLNIILKKVATSEYAYQKMCLNNNAKLINALLDPNDSRINNNTIMSRLELLDQEETFIKFNETSALETSNPDQAAYLNQKFKIVRDRQGNITKIRSLKTNASFSFSKINFNDKAYLQKILDSKTAFPNAMVAAAVIFPFGIGLAGIAASIIFSELVFSLFSSFFIIFSIAGLVATYYEHRTSKKSENFLKEYIAKRTGMKRSEKPILNNNSIMENNTSIINDSSNDSKLITRDNLINYYGIYIDEKFNKVSLDKKNDQIISVYIKDRHDQPIGIDFIKFNTTSMPSIVDTPTHISKLYLSLSILTFISMSAAILGSSNTNLIIGNVLLFLGNFIKLRIGIHKQRNKKESIISAYRSWKKTQNTINAIKFISSIPVGKAGEWIED